MANAGSQGQRASYQLGKATSETPLKSICIALKTTTFSFVIADVAFVHHAAQYSQWRDVRSEFAFAPPTNNYLVVLICLAVSYFAVRDRQWLTPFGFGMLLCLMVSGGYATSNPPLFDVRPLLEFRQEMLLLALFLNACLIVGWICQDKHARLSTPIGANESRKV